MTYTCKGPINAAAWPLRCSSVFFMKRSESLVCVWRSSLKRSSLCRRAVSPWRPRRPWTAQAEAWRNLPRSSGTGGRLWPETRRRIWAAPTARPGKWQRTWKRGRPRRVLLLTRQSRRVPRAWRSPKQPETPVKTWPCAGTVAECLSSAVNMLFPLYCVRLEEGSSGLKVRLAHALVQRWGERRWNIDS